MALRADDVDLGRDRALVEHFQGGDLLAFDDLYRRYFGRVYRFCLRRVGDRHEAEELAQEAFARAYRALPGLQGERRFYPWISVIASRLCVDSHRRRGRTEPSDTIDLGSVDGGQEAIVDASDAELLNLAFERLATNHREVLKLREHEELSYQQIADHLSVTIGTVEARLFRARQALRREFAAVAGPDSGLAAIPVIGWLLRRFVAMRHRAADWAAAGNLIPAVGGMIAATVVVGATALIATGPEATNHMTNVGVIGASAPIVSTTSWDGAEPPSGALSTAAADSVTTARAGTPAPGIYVSPDMRSDAATVTDYTPTQQFAGAAPVGQTATLPFVGPVAVGVDPARTAADAVDEVGTDTQIIQRRDGSSAL